jgi:signal transduction histidine kinase
VELDAFAHTVAHDLKNPLGLILGHADLLRADYEELSPQAVKDSLRVISQTSRKMDNIIEELMLLAGVRKMQVTPQPLNMASIVAEVLNRLTALIEESQAVLCLPDAWPRAMGYGPWVEEVWANYISNACKYGGRPPRIELGADPLLTLAEESGGQGMIRFWTRDNGAGLTPEQQAGLFAPFTRLDSARATGHGLGLSIVQRIVEKLGGQVGLASQVSQGNTFFFTLPAA